MTPTRYHGLFLLFLLLIATEQTRAQDELTEVDTTSRPT